MSICKYVKFVAIVGMVFCGLSVVAQAAGTKSVQANRVAEVAMEKSRLLGPHAITYAAADIFHDS